MYYQNYEDYMKSVLGNSYSNEYINQNYNNPYVSATPSIPVNANVMKNTNIKPKNDMQNKSNISTYNKDMDKLEKIEKIKKMYPDIYCLLVPMVNKIVEENKNKEITVSLIENMTIEIYNNIEDDMMGRKVSIQESSKTSTNISNTRNTVNNPRIATTLNSMNANSRTSMQTSSNIHVANSNVRESSSLLNSNTQNSKKIGNPALKDLIKILIINKIIKNLENQSNQSQMMSYNPNVNQNLTNQTPMQNIGYYPNNQFIPNMQQMQMNQRINQASPMINGYNQLPQGNMMGNVSNMNYPFTNYFSTPYPEDEWAN